MGLDMYLYERRTKYMGDMKDKRAFGELFPDLVGGARYPRDFYVAVDTEVMYWRKANAIHNWFVQNVQNGNDDCEKYPVSINKLSGLLETIETVLENPEQHALDLLPPASGFFFGSTDINEDYIDDLERTEEKLRNLLAECAVEKLQDGYVDRNFFYEASW